MSAFNIDESYFSFQDTEEDLQIVSQIPSNTVMKSVLNSPKIRPAHLNSMIIGYSPTFGKFTLRRGRSQSEKVENESTIKFTQYVEKLNSDLLQQDLQISLNGFDNVAALDNQLAADSQFWKRHMLSWKKSILLPEVKEKVLMQGIPSVIRDQIWPFAVGNEMKIDMESLNFSDVSLVATNPSLVSLYHVIEMDLRRTFPTFSYYHEQSPMKDRLRRILLKFSFEYPSIGYVQGMSYLCGNLFLHMDMKQTFVALSNIVHSKFIVDFVLLKREKIHRWSKLFDEMVKLFLPRLYSHFMPYDLFADMFLIEWVITLYSKSLSLDVVAHIWDCYFVFGDIFLFQVGIGILKALEKVLMHSALEDFCHILRNEAKVS